MVPLSKDEVDRILDNNLVDEFDRLAGTPGYVLVPMPFQKVYILCYTACKTPATLFAANLPKSQSS